MVPVLVIALGMNRFKCSKFLSIYRELRTDVLVVLVVAGLFMKTFTRVFWKKANRFFCEVAV